MFNRLIAIWRSGDPLRRMYEQLISMGEAGQWMFESAWTQAVSGKVDPDVRAAILRRDIEVNETERSIRKHLVEHLVAEPGADVPACLVLMSVVKDAERVGDYCKDILDAAEAEARPLAECPIFDDFQKTYESVHALFWKTRKALAESDKPLGEEVMRAERGIGKRSDALIARIAALDVPCAVGVPWALIARYLKRMAAHLSNVASSMVMPLHELDYFDEKWIRGPGGREAE